MQSEQPRKESESRDFFELLRESLREAIERREAEIEAERDEE